MSKVKLTVTKSQCREEYCKAGDVYYVEDLCPPLCHELWNVMYPYVFALRNGATLDCGERKEKCFDACCPDGGRVWIHGEIVEE